MIENGTRLKIVSDGTPGKTLVKTEDGKEVLDITSIHWYIDVDGISKALIKLTYVEVNITGEVTDDVPELGEEHKRKS